MTTLRTWQGKVIDYAKPEVGSISVLDIAKGLSREYRFCGQSHGRLTMAQHAVLVSMIVPENYEKEGLFNNAAIAYMKDLPAGLKELLPDYKQVKNRLNGVIRRCFSLRREVSHLVTAAERVALATEYRDVFCCPGEAAGLDDVFESINGIAPLNERLEVLDEDESFSLFMNRYRELYVGGTVYSSCHKGMFCRG